MWFGFQQQQQWRQQRHQRQRPNKQDKQKLAKTPDEPKNGSGLLSQYPIAQLKQFSRT